jgi:hypothetical protein
MIAVTCGDDSPGSAFPNPPELDRPRTVPPRAVALHGRIRSMDPPRDRLTVAFARSCEPAKRPGKRSAFLVLARGTGGALPKSELDRFRRSAPPRLASPVKAKLTAPRRCSIAPPVLRTLTSMRRGSLVRGEVEVAPVWEGGRHRHHKATLWRD